MVVVEELAVWGEGGDDVVGLVLQGEEGVEEAVEVGEAVAFGAVEGFVDGYEVPDQVVRHEGMGDEMVEGIIGWGEWGVGENAVDGAEFAEDDVPVLSPLPGQGVAHDGPDEFVGNGRYIGVARLEEACEVPVYEVADHGYMCLQIREPFGVDYNVARVQCVEALVAIFLRGLVDVTPPACVVYPFRMREPGGQEPVGYVLVEMLQPLACLWML